MHLNQIGVRALFLVTRLRKYTIGLSLASCPIRRATFGRLGCGVRVVLEPRAALTHTALGVGSLYLGGSHLAGALATGFTAPK